MALNVWFAALSHFGIKITDIGKLAAGTDTNIIAPTMMALKDIMSTEASGAQSQFMTGNIESSSFGVFGISFGDDTQLIMSYVISEESGSFVSPDVITKAQAICTYLGRQLAQIPNMKGMIETGQTLPRNLLLKSFINASSIVKIEQGLPTDRALITKGIQSFINKLLNDSERLLELIGYVLGPEWNTEPSLWSSGYFTSLTRDTLLNGLADQVVFELANERPLVLVHTSDPRSLRNRTLTYLEEQIEVKNIDISDKIISRLKSILSEKADKYLNNLSVKQLHMAETHLFNLVVRDAFLEIAHSNPMVLLFPHSNQPIREKFNELSPDIQFNHFGTFLFQAVENVLNPVIKVHVEVFLNEFMSSLPDVELKLSSVGIMTTFLESILSANDQPELKVLVNASKTIPAKRKVEILEFLPDRGDQLQIESIEDAGGLTNATAKALVEVYSSVISRQFILHSNNPGILLRSQIDFYRTTGRIIKFANVLIEFYHLLPSLNLNLDLISPSPRDLLVSSMISNGFQIKVNDTVGKLNTRSRQVYFEGFDSSAIDESLTQKPSRLFSQIKSSSGIRLDDLINHYKTVDIKFSEQTTIPATMSEHIPETYHITINNQDVLVESIVYASARRLVNNILLVVEDWYEDLRQESQIIYSELEKINSINGLKSAVPKFRLPDVKAAVYGEKIVSIMEEFGEELETSYRDKFEKNWTEYLANPTSEISKKERNNVRKWYDKYLSDIERHAKSLEKNILEQVKEVEKSLKILRNGVKAAIWPDEEEIMYYDYKSSSLLTDRETALNDLREKSESMDGINEEQYENMSLNLSLTIFTNPPESIFERAYDDIISGNRRKDIKKFQNQSRSKHEFDNYLIEDGRRMSRKVYSAISTLIEETQKLYINKNGVVSSEGNDIQLHLGRIPLTLYSRSSLINEIFQFPNISVHRETNQWLISLTVFNSQGIDDDHGSVITFDDAVRFKYRVEFASNHDTLFQAMISVARIIEDQAALQMRSSIERIKDAIYAV